MPSETVGEESDAPEDASDALQKIFKEIDQLFKENAKFKSERDAQVRLVRHYEQERLQLITELEQLRQEIGRLSQLLASNG
jgi:seryl-tRNA synthetase